MLSYLKKEKTMPQTPNCPKKKISERKKFPDLLLQETIFMEYLNYHSEYPEKVYP